ncbi:hypothetical protein OY671_007762, partial [Metschnikowia pulcherrima]
MRWIIALTAVGLAALPATAFSAPNRPDAQGEVRRDSRAGNHATVRIDAPGRAKSKGTVESLAPGSASTLASLPLQPGTAHSTTTVQRSPVRRRRHPRPPPVARRPRVLRPRT